MEGLRKYRLFYKQRELFSSRAIKTRYIAYLQETLLTRACAVKCLTKKYACAYKNKFITKKIRDKNTIHTLYFQVGLSPSKKNSFYLLQ